MTLYMSVSSPILHVHVLLDSPAANSNVLQQVRGGQTRLAHITAPQSDFGGDGSKTDALYAMELALSFEKLNFQKLKELQAVAEKNSDAQMSDFVEAMLQEQVC